MPPKIFANAVAILMRWAKNTLTTPESAQRCQEEPEPSTVLGRALIIADRLDEPFARAVALADISRCQAEIGDYRGAASTARDALAVVPEILSNEWRDRAMDFIARSQAEIGDQAGALASAGQIRDASLRIAALVHIADAQAKAGDVAGALSTARDIDDASARSAARGHIVEAQARAGDVGGAFATAHDIDDASARAAVYGLIAEAQARAGNVDAALATARGIADAFWSAAALGRIACAQADFGDRQGAASTAREALAAECGVADTYSPIAGTSWLRAVDRSWSWRAHGLTGIAEALAKAGEVHEALVTASRIHGKFSHAVALATVAEVQVEAEDRQGATMTMHEALATASTVKNAVMRDSLFRVITEVQVKAGNLANALETAATIQSKAERAPALAEIARALARAGDRQGAADTFRDAFVVARAGALDQLGAVLRIQTEAGDVAMALKTAEAINDDALRATSLGRIAAALAATH